MPCRLAIGLLVSIVIPLDASSAAPPPPPPAGSIEKAAGIVVPPAKAGLTDYAKLFTEDVSVFEGDRKVASKRAEFLVYPPVPTAKDHIQLAATVEVNGVVDTYRDQYVRFVVSGPPRGGFSGGPVYHTRGFVLDMVIESLEDHGRAEPGFLAVLSIEALHEVLEQHGITPQCQMPPTDEEIAELVRKDREARETARPARRAARPGGESSDDAFSSA